MLVACAPRRVAGFSGLLEVAVLIDVAGPGSRAGLATPGAVITSVPSFGSRNEFPGDAMSVLSLMRENGGSKWLRRTISARPCAIRAKAAASPGAGDERDGAPAGGGLVLAQCLRPAQAHFPRPG